MVRTIQYRFARVYVFLKLRHYPDATPVRGVKVLRYSRSAAVVPEPGTERRSFVTAVAVAG